MNHMLLVKALSEQRLNVLKALKPDANARSAWNFAIQGVITALADSYDLTYGTAVALKELMLEVTI